MRVPSFFRARRPPLRSSSDHDGASTALDQQKGLMGSGAWFSRVGTLGIKGSFDRLSGRPILLRRVAPEDFQAVEGATRRIEQVQDDIPEVNKNPA